MTTVKSATPSGFHKYPFYAPRFWHGMRPLTWIDLLRQGRFRVHARRLHHVIGSAIATPVNTTLATLQQLFFGRRIATSELEGPPVFILGHWRSGTTLLHELLVRDERFSSPSTLQCFAPHHFLVSEWAFVRFGKWALPSKRPMDNMATGWDRPQEDEFALMNLGFPSPYRRIAFPNQPPVDMNYLDFEGLPKSEIDDWLQALRQFLINVSLATGRPLVIKSPTHTGRVGYLAKAFPEAKFVHITRDPRALFPSTVRLWRSLDHVQALQVPGPNHDYEDYVVECFRRMYATFHRDESDLEPQRLMHVRYEDLVKSPVSEMQRIYETLRLSDFQTVRSDLEEWARTEHKSYRSNQHDLSTAQESRIKAAWHEYFERYGYG